MAHFELRLTLSRGLNTLTFGRGGLVALLSHLTGEETESEVKRLA